MVTNDATLLSLKHNVLYEVAKMAWEGTLARDVDDLPYKMIPGPQAHYRCCIYKEREIIKQRARLAQGLCPTGRNTKCVHRVRHTDTTHRPSICCRKLQETAALMSSNSIPQW